MFSATRKLFPWRKTHLWLVYLCSIVQSILYVTIVFNIVFQLFMSRYMELMFSEGLEISQPALDPELSSEIHHRITIRDRKTKVHRWLYDPFTLWLISKFLSLSFILGSFATGECTMIVEVWTALMKAKDLLALGMNFNYLV